ncbi:hypothetical protein FUT69_08935 [Xylella taiwanensis]|uniref:Uncharacterized protein n=1 Tax=Xylella taiwanensis TaxID=1444770 RepID=Z9JHE3_9GAMM|nr:hypothetical protein [Xylella taiwanensis]AXI82851.1 hypothetical protein AB672_02190 [Xylella taiwanensis]EWS77569.1 hypothetical protein AF72_10170 [Xylella taiwanensis]MCD8455861.1 hypothetical protein [Xylella taiwanensis]MCD8458265.1 hypothetical protein [Xylella taiwanensis]MCD8460402.1 hypothetical protein [Xylella taiwanensis]
MQNDTEGTHSTIHTPQVSAIESSTEATMPTFALNVIDDGSFGTLVRECCVLVTLPIHGNRIAVVVALDLGGLRTISRTRSLIPCVAWRTRDPRGIAVDGRMDGEPAQYLDSLELPDCVADMLPKPFRIDSAALLIEAAKEVRHD